VSSTGTISGSGDLTLGVGAGIDIAGTANVLNLTTLGSSVVNSSLTSVGTLVGLTSSQPIVMTGGIKGGAVYATTVSASGDLLFDASGVIKSNGTTILAPDSLGSTVLASSLTSVGTLSSLTVGGAITATGLATRMVRAIVTGSASDVNASDLIMLKLASGNAVTGSSIDHFLDAIAGSGINASNGQLVADGAGAPNGIGDENATLTEGFNFGNATLTADRTWTLPGSPSDGDIVRVKAPSNLDGNLLTISKAGSQTIDGQTVILLETAGAAVNLIYVGGNAWCIF